MKALVAALALALPLAAAAQQPPQQPRDLGADAIDFGSRESPIDDRDMKLPEFPKADNLVAFDPRRPTTMKFFIDAKSLAVNPHDVIYYTVVIKGDADAQTVQYEGMHCAEGVRRVYAYGRRDGTWQQATGSRWQEIGPMQMEPYRYALSKFYFCPAKYTIRNPAEGLDALRRGEHLRANDLNDNSPRSQ